MASLTAVAKLAEHRVINPCLRIDEALKVEWVRLIHHNDLPTFISLASFTS
jgi:hypothetical protein